MSISALKSSRSFFGSSTETDSVSPAPGDGNRLRIYDPTVRTVSISSAGVFAPVTTSNFLDDGGFASAGFSFVASSGRITWTGIGSRLTFISYVCTCESALGTSLFQAAMLGSGSATPINDTRNLMFSAVGSSQSIKLRWIIELNSGDQLQPVFSNIFNANNVNVSAQSFTVE